MAANVEEMEMQFLYKEGGDLVFIDRSSSAQITVPAELIGDAADLMTTNLPCTVLFFNDRPVEVTLPNLVQLEVTAIDLTAGSDEPRRRRRVHAAFSYEWGERGAYGGVKLVE